MKSKLLQKKSYGLNASHDVVDGQQENIEDSSAPWKGREILTDLNSSVDNHARKDFPRLLKHGYRPARS
jgi:hypothetical protein